MASTLPGVPSLLRALENSCVVVALLEAQGSREHTLGTYNAPCRVLYIRAGCSTYADESE